jgi:hypothetical protein
LKLADPIQAAANSRHFTRDTRRDIESPGLNSIQFHCSSNKLLEKGLGPPIAKNKHFERFDSKLINKTEELLARILKPHSPKAEQILLDDDLFVFNLDCGHDIGKVSSSDYLVTILSLNSHYNCAVHFWVEWKHAKISDTIVRHTLLAFNSF